MKKIKEYSLSTLLNDEEFEKILSSLFEAGASEEEMNKALKALF